MTSLDVEKLIPHRDRMKLVEEVAAVDEKHAVTRSCVRSSWPLFSDGGVEATVLVELVAQTAAVSQSWRRSPTGGGKGRGWLVGIKAADFFVERLPLGTYVTTEATYLYGLEDYHVYGGRVTAGETLLATVELQVLRSAG